MSDPSAADDEPRTLPAPLELAVDVFVYAPLGFVLDAREQFPGYVDRGRRTVHAVARWTGRRARDAARETASALRGLGLEIGPGDEAADGDVLLPPTLSVVPDPEPGEATEAAGGPAGGGAPSEPPIDPDRLAIPGYESLSASQVVPRLVSLTPEELELIRRYETNARGRKTILNRIAQLQAG